MFAYCIISSKSSVQIEISLVTISSVWAGWLMADPGTVNSADSKIHRVQKIIRPIYQKFRSVDAFQMSSHIGRDTETSMTVRALVC
jgi:hypothetical protein